MLQIAKAASDRCRIECAPQSKTFKGLWITFLKPITCPLMINLRDLSKTVESAPFKSALDSCLCPHHDVFTTGFCLLCVKLHTGYIHDTCPNPTPVRSAARFCFTAPVRESNQNILAPSCNKTKKKQPVREKQSKIVLLRGMQKCSRPPI